MSAKYVNASAVPLSLGVFLATDHYDHDNDPNTISATALIKPLRQLILSARVPQDAGLPDLTQMVASRIGTAIHDGIERAWKSNYTTAMADLGIPKRVIDNVMINPTDAELAANPDAIPVYMEQRASRTIGKWKITGKYDFIGEGRVEDFKSTSVYTYIMGSNSPKYILQGSIYRWLDPKKITRDQMAIQFIFTDWSSAQARQSPDYPQQRFKEQVLDLMSLQETEHYVRTRLEQIDTLWDLPENELPPCTEEDLWRSEPVFKIYKNGDVTAKRSTKNFDNKQDAMVYMSTLPATAAMLEKPGQVQACKYCAAFPVCTQKDALIAAGELVL